MCYSPFVSLAFAIFGGISTGVAYSKPVLRKNYVFVYTAFYAFMELTQTVQYMFVNQCGLWQNVWLTELAYILVIIQPLMFHTVFYLRCRSVEGRSIFKVAITMFCIWMCCSILGRVLYDESNDANAANAADADADVAKWSYLYSNKTCTLRDTPTSHLYWQWSSRNLYDMNANYFSYLLIWFVPPWFVPKERLTIFSVILSFMIGLFLTLEYGKLEENPSTWCFVSAPFCIFMYVNEIKGFLCGRLHAKSQ